MDSVFILKTLESLPHVFGCSFRVKAYIENGWAHHIINPDGHSPTRSRQQCFSTDNWLEKIVTAFNSCTEVPSFSVSSTLNYFIKRTAVDGRATNDFKSMNSGEALFRCGHVQALSVMDEEEFWWVKADCGPEMKKGTMYRMVISLCRGSWQVNSAICGCPAGRGPRTLCKHKGALCYALANFCLFVQLPEFLSCTDVKQTWNRPAPKKHKLITVDQIKLTRREILSKPSGDQPIPGM